MPCLACFQQLNFKRDHLCCSCFLCQIAAAAAPRDMSMFMNAMSELSGPPMAPLLTPPCHYSQPAAPTAWQQLCLLSSLHAHSHLHLPHLPGHTQYTNTCSHTHTQALLVPRWVLAPGAQTTPHHLPHHPTPPAPHTTRAPSKAWAPTPL